MRCLIWKELTVFPAPVGAIVIPFTQLCISTTFIDQEDAPSINIMLVQLFVFPSSNSLIGKCQPSALLAPLPISQIQLIDPTATNGAGVRKVVMPANWVTRIGVETFQPYSH